MKTVLKYLLLAGLPLANLLAQTATVTPSATTYSAAGGTITFTVNLTYSAMQAALGLSIGTVPTVWAYGTTGGTNVPSVTPTTGDTGNFDFAYSTIPASPVSFTFTVTYPAGLTGNQTFSGIAGIFRPTGGSLQNLAVSNVVIGPPPAAPSFTTHPSGQSAVAGGNVSFTVVAAGNPTPTIQWQKGGVNLSNGGRISGAATSTLQITGVLTSDADSYRAVATNGLGSTATSNPATLTIGASSQTITFGALTAKTFGDASFALTATASSGLTVNYSSSNPAVASVSGGTVTIVGGGSTTITTSQAGNANFVAATPVPQVLTVNKAAATVALGSLSANFNGSPKAATATTNPVGLTVGFTYDGSAAAPTNAGIYAVLGLISSSNYSGSASGTLVIAKSNQTITFGALAQKAFNDPGFALTATANSGLAVSYASSNTAVATVSGSTVTIIALGSTTITASQAGSSNYNAATSVDQTLTVVRGSQTISFAALPVKIFPPASSFSLSATASSGLLVSYVSSNPIVASVSGSTVTVSSVGIATITASQAGNTNYNAALDVQQIQAVNSASVGFAFINLNAIYDGTPKPVSVTTTPPGLKLNIIYNGASTAPTAAGSYGVVVAVDDPVFGGATTALLTIAKAPQTIAFGPLAAKTMGDAPFSISAIATSGLPVVFSSSNPAVATVSGNIVTVTGGGVTTITASQPGDVNRSVAADVGQTLTVNKGAATVTLSGLSAVFDGTTKSASATTSPAGLPVTLIYNGSVSAPSAAGSYAVVATVNSPSYTGSASGTLVIINDPASRSPGAYFGSFAANGGPFAMFIRPNRTGAFLGYARVGGIPLVVREFVIESDGTFRFSAVVFNALPSVVVSTEPGRPPVAAAESQYTISGTIGADGSLAGSVSGLNLSFSAPATTATGATQSLAGFYQAGASGKSANSFTIVGAAGDAFVLTTDGIAADAAKGTIDAAGRLAATSEKNASIVGTLAGQASTIALTATADTGTVTFEGANNDARTDIEKLINISTRSQTGTTANMLIAGFVIAGTQSKPVLIRAIGPTLAAFGVAGALPAARLEVFRGQTSLAVGTDWGAAANFAAIAETAARVGAFALLATSSDASLLLTLAPGAYTAVVTGQGTASGVSLVEVYDATVGAILRTERIINIATRATAGTGDNTLIAGFYVAGTVPKRVLIRGVGPSLTQFGVAGVLSRPQLFVNSGSTVLTQNAGWTTSPDAADIAIAGTQVGAFALNAGSQDAALIVNLAPGAYTAGVTGVGGTTGVALIEVYEIP